MWRWYLDSGWGDEEDDVFCLGVRALLSPEAPPVRRRRVFNRGSHSSLYFSTSSVWEMWWNWYILLSSKFNCLALGLFFFGPNCCILHLFLIPAPPHEPVELTLGVAWACVNLLLHALLTCWIKPPSLPVSRFYLLILLAFFVYIFLW